MTQTDIARAMRAARPARALLIAVVALLLAASIAGVQPAHAQGVATVAAPAQWDSLYRERDYFGLRSALGPPRSSGSPVERFYRGIVAHAFNDNDAAIAELAPLVDSMPRAFATTHAAAALGALGDSYRRVFRYQESAAAYRQALRLPRSATDSASRADFTAWAAVAEALASVPPQQVQWTAQWNGTPLPNDSISFAVSTGVNGADLPLSFGVDAGARMTIIDSSTAAARGVRATGDPIRVPLRGRLVTARVAAIRTLQIGPAVVSNTPVLVLPDNVMRTLYRQPQISGVIGLPVLSALGGVTFMRDGHLALSSPGVDHDTSATPGIALAGDAVVVRASYGGRAIRMLLDPAAPRTVLYPSFLQEFSAAAAGASLTTYVGPARTGGVVSLPSYVIPHIALSIGDRAVALESVTALMRTNDPLSSRYSGALGRDALANADRVTLDFAAMTARFRDQPPPSVLPQIVYPTVVTDSTSVISKVPEDIAFVALLFALFVIPKALQRYRIASAVTSLIMGATATALGLFHNDPTLHLLSTFGIVALFLFAGLEIDGHELRRQASPLILHGLVWSALLAVGAAVANLVFGFAVRPALLIALALLTPSTGFILSSLSGFGLHDSERFAVKTYVIASELLALTVLFFVLQSTSAGRLAIAVAAMLGVVTVIPLAFKLFARWVAPHAPRSEFAFLLMVAIVCAYATRRLGVYYLVGAFLVGIAAQRFRSELPAMSSEKMVDALESFGSVFIPFYFFHAGTEIVREQLTLRALSIGLVLIVLLIPLRVAITLIQRRFVLHDSFAGARRVGIALVPTLVFTLVITDILNTSFGIEKYILGALVLYTVINTSVPAFVLHSAPPEFENVEAAEIGHDRTSRV